MSSLLLFSPGLPEMAVIFFAILLLFGGKKIPELMKGLGKGIREFNTAKATIKEELEGSINEEEPAK